MDEDRIAEVERDNAQAVTDRERAQEADNDSEEKRSAYESVKAIIGDAKWSLSVGELAQAITVGLYEWGEHVQKLQELASHLVEHSGQSELFKE